LTKLDLSPLTDLRILACDQTEITQAALKYLKCYNSQLTELLLPIGGSLKEMDCFLNKLRSLDITGKAELKKLDCSQNKISQLILAQCETLRTLNASNNRLTALDLSDCGLIHDVDVRYNYFTTEANILWQEAPPMRFEYDPQISLADDISAQFTDANFLTAVREIMGKDYDDPITACSALHSA
jgi:hypothetical protein